MSEQTGNPVLKWHQRTSVVVLALLAVGPFALPLVWANPRFRRSAKVLITIVVFVGTYYLVIGMRASLEALSDYYGQIF